MPRNYKRHIRGQKQTNDQQNFDFSVPSRKVAARPVGIDTPSRFSSKAQQIIDFTENFRSAARSLTQAHGVYAADQKYKGAMSAAKGEDEPKRGILGTTIGGESDAFIVGYENYKGDVEVGDFHKKIDNLLQNSGDMDELQWLAAKDKIAKEIVNGRSDAFLEAFIPKASKLEEKYDIKFHQMLKERVDKNFLAGVGEIAESELTQAFSDETLTPEERDVMIRKSVTSQQERAKFLKMGDRNSVSATYINKAIFMAKSQGRPEFLRWLSQPDKDGVVLASHPDFADAIASAKITSENIKEANENAADTERRRRLKELGDTIEKKIIGAMEDGDLAPAKEAILAAEPFLEPAAFKSMLKEVNKGLDESTFGRVTNADNFMMLFDMAVQGKLTTAHFAKYRMQLTKDDYMELGQVNSRAKESARGSNTSKPQYMKEADEYKGLLKTLVTGNKLVNMYKLPEKQKIAKATHLWNMAIQAELKKNGSENLGFDWYNKTMNAISKAVLAPEERDKKDKPTGGNIGSKQPNSGKGTKNVLSKYN